MVTKHDCWQLFQVIEHTHAAVQDNSVKPFLSNGLCQAFVAVKSHCLPRSSKIRAPTDELVINNKKKETVDNNCCQCDRIKSSANISFKVLKCHR